MLCSQSNPRSATNTNSSAAMVNRYSTFMRIGFMPIGRPSLRTNAAITVPRHR